MSFTSQRKVDIEDPSQNTERGPDFQTVNKFAELMERELLANTKKGGRAAWLKMLPMDHLLQIYYHVGKLQAALKAWEVASAGDENSISRSEVTYRESQVKEFAADVANHSLMLLDTMDLLGVPPPKASPVQTTYHPDSRRESYEDDY